ncbi:MAG TPA: TolC family protein [Candidatus Sulfotelmatobacter sp.]|nr:TolC family protein [Candidatus Sulfotelmatobacter sp.]
MRVSGEPNQGRTASVDALWGVKPIKMLKSTFVVLLIVLIVTPPATGQQNPPGLPNPLTLSQAVTIALSNNSVIRQAQARLAQSSGQYAQARSPLLPQVEARARQDYLTINLRGLGIDIPTVPQGKSDPFGSLDARIILRQDLLNIANREAWKSSGARQESSRLLLGNAREVVVLNVVAAYLQALRVKASRDALAEQTKLADDLYKVTQNRVKQGVSARLEAVRAQQQVNSLEQQRQEAEQNYIAAKLTLANTLQTNITADFEVADAAAYGAEAALDRATAVNAALNSRPDYRAAKSNIRAAELQVHSARANRYPILSTSFSDGQSGETPVHNQNTFRLSGTLNIPIYDSGRIRGQIDEALGALQESKAGAEQLRSQIETDVLAAIAGVEWATREVTTSAANVQLSREEVELSRQRFAQGVTDNTEVVNAQDRVSRADDARVRAMYTLGLARANLARAMGAAEKTYRK